MGVPSTYRIFHGEKDLGYPAFDTVEVLLVVGSKPFILGTRDKIRVIRWGAREDTFSAHWDYVYDSTAAEASWWGRQSDGTFLIVEKNGAPIVYDEVTNLVTRGTSLLYAARRWNKP